MLKQALDFALLEDFDHLYRYANLYELIDGKDAAALTDSLTEITPGRPTVDRAPPPHDDLRGHFETHTVDPLSRLHVMTIVAGRAADDELLHEPRHRLDRADRPWAVRRDRADRGAARHPLRVAARPARLVAQAARLPRVQRGLPLLVDAPERGGRAHHGASGSCTSTWRSASSTPRATCCAATRASSPRSSCPPTLPGHAGHVRAEQGLRPRGPRRRRSTSAPTASTTCGTPTCPRTTVPGATATSSTPAAHPASMVIDQNRAANGRDYRDETEGENPVPAFRPAART